MKKLLLLSVAFALIGSLFAYNDYMIQSEQKIAKMTKGSIDKLPELPERDAPDVEFDVDPTSLSTTFYDYMMGSYSSLPLRILSDGQAYTAFHGQESSQVNRRVYYSFIEQGGDNSTMTIGTTDNWEGYAGIDVDPVTDDPFVAWHVEADAAAEGLEIVVSYDMYHVQGAGYWKAPFVVISSNIPSPYDDDQFIFPYVYIGNSPLTGKRRVYISSANVTSHGPGGNPSENVLLAFADFDGNDILAQSELEWNYTTIPVFDNWNAGNPETRPFKAMAVSETDGRIAYMGWNTTDEAFVVYNDNYGEGEWNYVSTPFQNEVDLPLNEDGSSYFSMTDSYFSHVNDGHFNVVFNDEGNLVHTGAMGLQGTDSESGDSVYIPYAIYPYNFSFDFETEEFSFQVLDPQINENAANLDYEWETNQVYLPWDTDNDGTVDEFQEDGSIGFLSGWPIYYHENDKAFHENEFYTVSTGDRMVAVWMDGVNNKLAQDGTEGYEDWVEVAEIAISVSNNGGDSWSEAIKLNNINTDELEGMKPAYVYPGDVIEDMGNGYGRLHLMFLDDNSFGSSVHNVGNADGGTIKYAALEIYFGGSTSSDKDIITPEIGIISHNYPNPFNPTTTISYSLKSAGDVAVGIFNSKGQMVKTLVNEPQAAGTHNVTWNGKDSNNNALGSGIYFYNVKSGDFSTTKKMMLLK